MDIQIDEKIVLGVLVVVSFFVGAMAAPGNSKGNGGFNEYGYNDNAGLFINCVQNYDKWKAGNTPSDCPEGADTIHSKWFFDREGNLESLMNLIYNNDFSVLNKFVTVNKTVCDAQGGEFWGKFTVTPTGENVPVCQIQGVVEGDAPSSYTKFGEFIASPPGYGFYKDM